MSKLTLVKLKNDNVTWHDGSENVGNGYLKDDGTIGLINCPSCCLENYAMMVYRGICAWCGYDANENN